MTRRMSGKIFGKELKNDFPIFQRKIEGKPLIYFDTASTSQKPKRVIEAICDFYQNCNANIHRGIYKIAQDATEKYEKARRKVAEFVGAEKAKEIIFTKGTTEAVNLVSFSWGEENIKKGDNIVVTLMEHHSNFVPWQNLAKNKKADLRIAAISREGKIGRDHLLSLVDKKTKLVALSYVSNVLGTINPVKEIVQEVKQKNRKIRVLIDAAQAVGHFPVRVKNIGCDFFAFSGHKMLGPLGVGALFAKEDVLEKMPPFIKGGHMIKSVRAGKTLFNDIPWLFEAGTQDIAAVAGLAEAIGYLEGLSLRKISACLQEFTSLALSELSEIPGIKIYGPASAKERISLISFNIKSLHPHDIAQFLDKRNIAVRAGHHCAMPLHNFFGVNSSVRVSFYIYNQAEEIHKLKDALLAAKKFFS